jgi:hypothetical protein
MSRPSRLVTPASALVIAAALAFAAGCSGGTPSAATSKAAGSRANGVAGFGPGTSSGSGSGTGIRIVAFDANSALPPVPGAGIEVWILGATASGAPATGAELKINGTAVAPSSVTISTTATGGLFADLANVNPLPQNNDTLEIDVPGTTLTSNVVTVLTAAYPSGNTGATGFTATSPQDASVHPAAYPQATPFQFTAAQTVSSYCLITLLVDSNATSGAIQLLGLPIAVELPKAAAGANPGFTAGSATGVTTEFVNGTLPPVTGTQSYAWNVVALNSNGWGVGTTIDFSSAASWPFFTTQ